MRQASKRTTRTVVLSDEVNEAVATTQWDYLEEHGENMTPTEAEEFWESVSSWEPGMEPPADDDTPEVTIESAPEKKPDRDPGLTAQLEERRREQMVKLSGLLEEMLLCDRCMRITALQRDLNDLQPLLIKALYAQHEQNHHGLEEEPPRNDDEANEEGGMHAEPSFDVVRSASFGPGSEQPQPGSTVSDLPDDIWTVIFEFMSPLSFVKLSYASQWLRRFAETEGCWDWTWTTLHYAAKVKQMGVLPLPNLSLSEERVQISKGATAKRVSRLQMLKNQTQNLARKSNAELMAILFSSGGWSASGLGDPPLPWSLYFSFRLLVIKSMKCAVRMVIDPTAKTKNEEGWALRPEIEGGDPPIIKLMKKLDTHYQVVESQAWAELHHLTKNDFARQYAAAKANLAVGMYHMAGKYFEGLEWDDAPHKIKLLLNVADSREAFEKWKSEARMKALDSAEEKEADATLGHVVVVKGRDYRTVPARAFRKPAGFTTSRPPVVAVSPGRVTDEPASTSSRRGEKQLTSYDEVRRRLEEIRLERAARRSSRPYRRE